MPFDTLTQAYYSIAERAPKLYKNNCSMPIPAPRWGGVSGHVLGGIAPRSSRQSGFDCVPKCSKTQRGNRVRSVTSRKAVMGSIPIARSINPIDSNTFTGLKPPKPAHKRHDFGRSWTRDCCKMVQSSFKFRFAQTTFAKVGFLREVEKCAANSRERRKRELWGGRHNSASTSKFAGWVGRQARSSCLPFFPLGNPD